MENKIIPALLFLFLVPLSFLSGCTSEKSSPTGTLEVITSPRGAEVYLDSVYIGTTPLKRLGISPGSHTVELRLTGYEIWTTTGTMEEGGYARVDADLVPVSSPAPVATNAPIQTGAPAVTSQEAIRKGSLIVASKPGSADVYIDSVYRGKTPLTLKDMPEGKYTIQISESGYEDWTGEATVAWMRTAVISAPLVTLPPTMVPATVSSGKGVDIIVHPIGDVRVGTTFKITGDTVNLVELETVSVGIHDPQDQQAVWGIAAVLDSGFSFDVDASSLKPGMYHVEVWAGGMPYPKDTPFRVIA